MLAQIKCKKCDIILMQHEKINGKVEWVHSQPTMRTIKQLRCAHHFEQIVTDKEN